MPTVGLFVPCYVDQLHPRVGVAALRLLERHGVKVEFPPEQTCCGQPMANSGCLADAAPLAERFLRIFSRYEQVVAPSGSCVSMVRHHYDGFLAGRPGFDRLKENTFELCEYLHDVVGVREAGVRFPHVVGLHRACHGLRELRLGSGTERRVPPFDKVKALLDSLDGIRVVEPSRPDECCGFGGTFAVNEEAVSCMMGKDKLADLAQAGAEVVASADVSCLMHLDGLARRAGAKFRFMHVAEVLLGEQ
ncbi:MAG TPA: (Fe-S)-binding protein [Anaeromyxobacteraceae bacterium]|nr:(Fe-S)-binding protein [Anaeromyxobacteraceae bacterium]